MRLFSRKKKDDEDNAAEREALAEQDTDEPAEAAEKGEAALGAQATAVRETVPEPSAEDDIPAPPPEHKSRLDDGDAPELVAEREPEAEQKAEPEAEQKAEPEPEVETPPPSPAAQPAPLTSDPSRSEGPGQSPLEAHEAAVAQHGVGEDKPELLVAGAFLGGLVLAQVIRWMGGDDD
jgi:hypothetical protein